MVLRGWFLATTVLAVLAVATASGNVSAQDASDDPAPEPVLLEADDLTVDDTLDIIIASGSVRLAREGRIVLADRITYNRLTERVTATGNVSIIEETGDVFFGQYIELENEFAEGFVDRVGALLADDSRLAGRRAIRREQGVTTLDDGIYSPCLPCADNPDRPLIWQLRASEVEHDSESMDITYRNVFLDFFGVPILYTPYFSTPDPRVRSRTGWLNPAFGSTSTLGRFLDFRYFIDIAPEQDATLRAMPTSERGVMVEGEYRRRFESGRISIVTSANISEPEEGEDKEFRGHIFADGRFDIDDNWRLTGQIRRSTDDNYLEDFNITDDNVIESNILAEGFYGLNYHVAEAISFQDLRGNVEDEPIILPWVRSSLQTEPGSFLGGQGFIDSEFLYIRRPGEGRRSVLDGTDTLRASADFGWRHTAYSPVGLVFDFELGNRSTVWLTQDLFDSKQGAGIEPTDTQAFLTVPRLHTTARYPFARVTNNTTQVIEPILAATVAPRFGLSDFEDIPRNDSIAPELDEISIFRPNRFPGFDRYDGGSRLTVGGRYSINTDRGDATVLLAQSFRSEESELFDPETGLAGIESDVVGRITASFDSLIDLDYRFRLDNETLQPRRHELNAGSRFGPLSLSGTYTYLAETRDARREELSLRGSAQIVNGWSTRGRYILDLQNHKTTEWSAALRYSCECLLFDISYRARPPRDDHAILVRLSLANLGDFDFDFGFDDSN